MRIKNACVSACMSVHTIVFTVFTCFVALYQEGVKITAIKEFNWVPIAATVCSLLGLVHNTNQNYRVNGAWICFNLIMVNSNCHFAFIVRSFDDLHDATCVLRSLALRSF